MQSGLRIIELEDLKVYFKIADLAFKEIQKLQGKIRMLSALLALSKQYCVLSFGELVTDSMRTFFNYLKR